MARLAGGANRSGIGDCSCASWFSRSGSSTVEHFGEAAKFCFCHSVRSGNGVPLRSDDLVYRVVRRFCCGGPQTEMRCDGEQVVLFVVPVGALSEVDARGARR